MSETGSGRKCELFKFVQGYSTEAKAGRRVNDTANVETFVLRKVVGMPGEAISSGDGMAYEVSVDQDDETGQKK